MNDPIFFNYYYDQREILEHFTFGEPEEADEESEIGCLGPLLQMNPAFFPLPLDTILFDTFIRNEGIE